MAVQETDLIREHLSQNPLVVLEHNGELHPDLAGQRVHFGRVNGHFKWQSFAMNGGRLVIPEPEYGGSSYGSQEQAERTFRRLAASYGFTREEAPSKL